MDKGSSHVPESILKPSGDVFEVAHAACAGCLSALGLLSPLIRAQPRRWVAALGAGCFVIRCRTSVHETGPTTGRTRTLVLFVECPVSTTPAERVGLGVPLTVVHIVRLTIHLVLKPKSTAMNRTEVK